MLAYTDQISLGIERQLHDNLSVCADYVHGFGRDMLMAVALNPTLRDHGDHVAERPTGQCGADGDHDRPAADLPGLRTVHWGGHHLRERRQDRVRRLHGAGGAPIPQQLQRGRLVHPGVLERKYQRRRRTGKPFQVLDDLNLDLNEGPTNYDQRHNLVLSGMAIVPGTGGFTVSWVARALSGSPFTAIPLTFTEHIHWQLRQVAVAGTSVIVPWFGIPIFVEGTTLHTAQGSLEGTPAVDSRRSMPRWRWRR